MSDEHEHSGAIVKKRGPRQAEDLAVAASVDAGPLGKWRVRAAGLYGGTVVSAAVFIGVLTICMPMSKPEHFVLALVASGVLGAFLHGVATRGHIRVLLDRIGDLKAECHRMAERNKELEKRVLERRLSSVKPKGK